MEHAHACMHARTHTHTHTHRASLSLATCVVGSLGPLLKSGSSLPFLLWYHIAPGKCGWTSGTRPFASSL